MNIFLRLFFVLVMAGFVQSAHGAFAASHGVTVSMAMNRRDANPLASPSSLFYGRDVGTNVVTGFAHRFGGVWKNLFAKVTFFDHEKFDGDFTVNFSIEYYSRREDCDSGQSVGVVKGFVGGDTGLFRNSQTVILEKIDVEEPYVEQIWHNFYCYFYKRHLLETVFSIPQDFVDIVIGYGYEVHLNGEYYTICKRCLNIGKHKVVSEGDQSCLCC